MADSDPRQGALPDASFDTTFRKYTPPDNTFSPFYSWDASMRLDVTVYRRASSALAFTGIIQAIGTENLGRQVSVGGTGYILTGAYVRARSPALTLSAGMTHLSSHLTRDLDDKIAEERTDGRTIPVVKDPDQYNVFFFKVSSTFWTGPAALNLDLVVQPITFRLFGDLRGNSRPLFAATRWTPWRGDRKSLTVETQHEVGARPFNRFSLALGLFERRQSDGRLQLVVSASPGAELHVSPNIGAFRNGISLGVRVKFRE
jgi:hypothetical protein